MTTKPQIRTAPAEAAAPDASDERNGRRIALLDAMAGHLLAHGLAGSPLRKLAAAAGTSDRMLLYYFADRHELLTALLKHVAARLATTLAANADASRRTWADLLRQLWAAARMPVFRPHMLLFLELGAAAGRGEEPHRTAAGQIVDGFAEWVAARIDTPEDERHARAMLLLATLDGLFLLDAAGRGREADAAAASV